MSTLAQREATAWRQIAAKVAEEGLSYSGLCAEIPRVAGPFSVLRDVMQNRINRHLDGWTWFEHRMETGEEIGPHAPETERAQLRMLMALFLAEEAEGEGDAV